MKAQGLVPFPQLNSNWQPHETACPHLHSLSPAAVKIFKDRGVEADVKVGLKPEELKRIIGAYQGLAIRSNTKVTPRISAPQART